MRISPPVSVRIFPVLIVPLPCETETAESCSRTGESTIPPLVALSEDMPNQPPFAVWGFTSWKVTSDERLIRLLTPSASTVTARVLVSPVVGSVIAVTALRSIEPPSRALISSRLNASTAFVIRESVGKLTSEPGPFAWMTDHCVLV